MFSKRDLTLLVVPLAFVLYGIRSRRSGTQATYAQNVPDRSDKKLHPNGEHKAEDVSSSVLDAQPDIDFTYPDERKIAEEVAKVVAMDATADLQVVVQDRIKQSINETFGGMSKIFARVQDKTMRDAQQEATEAAVSFDADALLKAANKMKSAESMKKLLGCKQDEIGCKQNEGTVLETPEGDRKKGRDVMTDGDDNGNDNGTRTLGPSTTAFCIISLLCQYFLIHTALAVARATFQCSSSESAQPLLATLEAATPSLSFVPMLSVLFYAVRLRVVYLVAQGVPEHYGLPYWWVQWGQVGACIGVFVQLCFVILVAALTGAPPAQDNLEERKPLHVEVGHPCCSTFFVVLQYIGIIAMHLGAGLCCIGIVIMRAPEHVHMHKGSHPTISGALWCVMILSLLYFIVFMALQCARTSNQLRGDGHSKAQDVLQLAGFVLRVVPMFCVLCMCVRIRATQISPDYKEPRWVDWPMLGCTGGILLQTILTIAIPGCCGGKAKKGAAEADITFETEGASRCCSAFFEVLRWILLLGVYGGSCMVLISVFGMKDPDIPTATPRLTRSMQCTLVLAILFFLVHLLFFVGLSCRQWCAGQDESPVRHPCLEALEAAVDTVEISSMLCILFLSARLRASLLVITGQPQGWAQDAMVLATLSVFGQLVMVLFRACLPAASHVETGCCTRCCWVFLEIFRFVVMIGTFGGAGIVIFALITMTPESASGGDSSWLLPKRMNMLDDHISLLH